MNILNQVASSSIQIASASSGSFANAMQIKRHVESIHKMWFDEENYSLIRLSESITLLATSIFFSRTAGIIHDTVAIGSGIVDLTKGKKEGLVKISFSALSLTAQLTLNIHVRVALIAVTILFDVASSIDSFRNERYIEGVGSLICTAIRIKKSEDILQKYRQIWSPSQIERRVAVDIGSGSTKVIIADVDKKTNRIVNIVHKDSIAMPYQKDLEDSEDGAFSSDIQEAGINTFHEIKRLAKEYQADKVYGVATSAFRTSKNGEAFAKKVTDFTGIPIQIISQHEEGVLAYESVSDAPELPSKKYVCWDIGTGSFQITSSTEKDAYTVYMTKTGSVPFKNYIIEVVKGEDSKEVDTPNPLNRDTVKQADRYARRIGRQALPAIKSSVKGHNGIVVGIGRLFQNSLLPMARGEQITRRDLRKYVRNAEGKSDAQLDNPFARVDVSNAILALGVMKALHIHRVSVVESTSTKGMLVHKAYWQN